MKLSKKAKGNTATPKATPKTTPKSQNKKKAMMNTPEKIEVDQDQIVIGAGGDELKDEKVTKIVDQLIKLVEEKKKGGNELFEGDEGKINLQIAGIKLPRDERKQLIKMVLPHAPLPNPSDVCLIVKDLEKGIRPDHENTLNHFNEMLEERGVKDKISQIIAFRELKVEHKQYESKTALVMKFDKFLVDDRIVRLVPKFLGKPFYKRKRFPVAINLAKKDLKAELDRCLKTAVLPLNHHGNCAMVNVAHTDMGAKEIVENILAASKVLAKRYPGGWKNIRSLQIKAEKTIAIPAYVSLTSGNDIGFVDSDAPARVRREAVTGDLSTQPGMEITVLPAGKIKITKKKDPEWDDEKDEPFNEDSDNEEDKEAADKKEEEKKKKKTAVKRKKEEEGEKKDDKKKSKKKKNAQEEEEDSEDEEMQDAEMKYMQKVAEEEEAIEAKEESKKDKKEGANDEESEGEEEENDEEESGDEGEESELDSDDVLVDEDSDDDESEEDDDKQLILRKKSAGSSDEEDSD